MFSSSLLPVLACSLTAYASPASLSPRATSDAAVGNAVSVSIDAGSTFQEMDGLGVSEAFARADEIVYGSSGLSLKNQSYVLDLLFDLEKGAGFTILRNGIGTWGRSSQIEPNSPGSPSAKPDYVWDRNDTGQFKLAQQAYDRGLKHLYGSAWSAPAFMKTSNSDVQGYLCGVTNATCATGNWIKAYADYLLQWVWDYQSSGVDVTELGFLNEPEIHPTYVSMLSNGTQAADTIRVLGPAVRSSGLDLKLTCCDGVGWQHQQEKMAALQAGPDPAENYLDIITGHGYASAPTFPLNTTKKSWQTEWSDLATDNYIPRVFYKSGSNGEGMTWASNIQTAYVKANVSGFLYWIGAETGSANTGLINLHGDEVVITKRFWAHAQFSKFARPGARRIDADSNNSNVTVSSFLNKDGSVATQVINNQDVDVNLSIQIKGSASDIQTVTPYLTDNDNDLTVLSSIQVSGGQFNANIPARSLVSFVATSNGHGEDHKGSGSKSCKARHHQKEKKKAST